MHRRFARLVQLMYSQLDLSSFQRSVSYGLRDDFTTVCVRSFIVAISRIFCAEVRHAPWTSRKTSSVKQLIYFRVKWIGSQQECTWRRKHLHHLQTGCTWILKLNFHLSAIQNSSVRNVTTDVEICASYFEYVSGVWETSVCTLDFA